MHAPSLHCYFTQKFNKRETSICRCTVLFSAKRMKHIIAQSSKFTLIRIPPMGIQGSWKEDRTLEEHKTLGFAITCDCCCAPFKSCTKSSRSPFFSDLVNSEQGYVLSSLFSSWPLLPLFIIFFILFSTCATKKGKSFL